MKGDGTMDVFFEALCESFFPNGFTLDGLIGMLWFLMYPAAAVLIFCLVRFLIRTLVKKLRRKAPRAV